MIIVHYYFFVLYASTSALPNPTLQEQTYSTEITFNDFPEETTKFESSVRPPAKNSTVVFHVNNLLEELPSPTLEGEVAKKLTHVDRTENEKIRCESPKPIEDHNVEQTSTDKIFKNFETNSSIHDETTSSIHDETTPPAHENTQTTDHGAAIFDEQHAVTEENNYDGHSEEIRQQGDLYADTTLLHLLVTSLFCLTIVMMLASIVIILYIGISTVQKAQKLRFSKNTGADNTHNNKFAY